MKLWWTWLSVAAVGAMAAGAGAGCGDDGNSGSGGTGGTSSSPSASSGPTGSSSSGEMMGSGGSMAGSGGSMAGSGGSMAGSGGSGGYADCSACTNGNTGAYTKECKAQTDACLADATCAKISQCSFQNCGSDQAGACCTVQCFKDNNASQATIDLYLAMDGCVYCDTCKAPLCDNTNEYCAVFKPGGDAVCAP